MNTTELQMLTIVGEAILQHRLLEDLQRLGATGWSVSHARGRGSTGRHTSDWEGPNVRIETIVTDATCSKIFDHLAQHYFEHYAVVAWASTVRVARPAKFG
jgi:nitrogen regulatory protein P-II 2